MSEHSPATELAKLPRPYESFYLLYNWTYWRLECDFEYRKLTAGRKVFVGCQNVEVYAMSGNMHLKFHPSCSSWRAELEDCRVLTVPSLQVFSYFLIWRFVGSRDKVLYGA